MTFNHALSTNNYGPAKFIVDASAANGTHTTIASALTSASSGDTIFIRPGTYTENISLKSGVNLTAYGSDGLTTNQAAQPGTSNVTIVGSVTASFSGEVTLNGLQLKTNAAAALIISGSSTSSLFLNDCTINASNSTGMTFNNSNCFVTFFTCYFISTSTNNLFTLTACPIDFEWCVFALSATATASTISTNNAVFNSCDMQGVSLTTSTSGTVFVTSCFWQYAGNTLLTTAGTGISTIQNSYLASTTASTVSIGTGTTVNIHNSTISSGNTNAITGAGTLIYGGVVFPSTSTINTSTQTPLPWTVQQGGSAASTLTGILTGNGTSAFTANAVTQHGVLIGGASNAASSLGVAATGTILAGVTSSDPSFQSAAGLGASLVLIQQKTYLNNDASVIFTSIPHYAKYMITFDNVRPLTAGDNLLIQYSTDNGGTYVTTNYTSGCNWNAYNSATLNNVNTTSAFMACPNVSQLTVPGVNAIGYLFNTTNNLICYYGSALFANNTGSVTSYSTATGSNTGFTIFNALKIFFSTGNLGAPGTITLYGIRES